MVRMDSILVVKSSSYIGPGKYDPTDLARIGYSHGFLQLMRSDHASPSDPCMQLPGVLGRLAA